MQFCPRYPSGRVCPACKADPVKRGRAKHKLDLARRARRDDDDARLSASDAGKIRILPIEGERFIDLMMREDY